MEKEVQQAQKDLQALRRTEAAHASERQQQAELISDLQGQVRLTPSPLGDSLSLVSGLTVLSHHKICDSCLNTSTAHPTTLQMIIMPARAWPKVSSSPATSWYWSRQLMQVRSGKQSARIAHLGSEAQYQQAFVRTHPLLPLLPLGAFWSQGKA